VLITFERMRIEVFIEFDYDLAEKKELNTSVPVSMAKVFSVKDVDVRKGSFGLFANNMSDLSSNLISYKPDKCKPIDSISAVKVVP